MFLNRSLESAGDGVSEKLLRVAQYVLVVVFGLLPIFFVPGTDVLYIYTKVALVVVAVLAAMVLFSFSLLRSGTLKLYVPRALIALLLFFVASLVSAVLSADFRDAFMGNSLEIHSAAFVGLLAFVALVWMHVANRKETAIYTYALLLLSALGLFVFHISRIAFGSGFLSLGLFGADTLSPIGSWNNLAVFFGLVVILSLIALEQLTLALAWRLLFIFGIFASLVMLMVVNLFSVWVVLGFVSLVVLIYGLARDRLAVGREGFVPRPVSKSALVVSFVTLLLAAAFVIGGSVAGNIVSNTIGISYIEVRPSLEATTDIAGNVYKTQALFGIGPNRFSDAWRLYREPEINNTIFWGTDFGAGFGYVPTFFVTTGVIGGILFTAFFLLFVYSGIQFLTRARNADRVWYFIGTSAFAGGVYIWGVSFIYVPGPVLLLIAAMCTGLVYASGNALMPERLKTYVIGASPRGNLILVVIAVLCVGASVAAVYGVGQHYLAAYYYNEGFQAFRNDGDVVLAENMTVRAFGYWQDDLFARRIAEYENIRVFGILSATEGDQAELQARFEESFNNGVSAARVATELDPNDADNWSVLGNFYAAITRFEVDGAYDQAKAFFTRARELDPQNPSRVLALSQLELLRGDTDAARSFAEEALRLKPDYGDAVYMIAEINVASGDLPAAVEAAKLAALLEPQNPVRYLQLGILEITAQNPAGAVTALEQAIARNEEYSNARYFLAFAYDQLGRTQDARAQLARVLELNPGNPQVLTLIERLDRGQPLMVPEASSVPQPGEGGPSASETTNIISNDEPVTSGNVPDSPLLSPANVGAEGNGQGE